MRVYRLSPILNSEMDPAWQYTKIKFEDCWVLAETDEDARQKVALATKEDSPQASSKSAWMQKHLAECFEDANKPLCYGIVVSASGSFTVK